MTGRIPGIAILAALPVAPGSAVAQSSGGSDAFIVGIAIGQAVLVVLAVLIALSVLAKLVIVSGIVPREPENRFHALIHRAAGFVGRLRPARSLRDRHHTDRSRGHPPS